MEAPHVGDPISITERDVIVHAHITAIDSENANLHYHSQHHWWGARSIKHEGITWVRGHVTGEDAAALVAARALMGRDS